MPARCSVLCVCVRVLCVYVCMCVCMALQAILRLRCQQEGVGIEEDVQAAAVPRLHYSPGGQWTMQTTKHAGLHGPVSTHHTCSRRNRCTSSRTRLLQKARDG